MKNNNIIISVYITNRNYGNFLEKAIKSYLNQTFKEKELIIVDDSSKDNSKKIIEKYESRKICRAIYNSKNQGLIKSSNLAIKSAKGNYVLRLDADDYLDPNALTIFYQEISRDPNIALVYSDYYIVDNKNNILSFQKQMVKNEILSNQEPALAACCLIRKSALFSVNLYDERFNRQDGYDIWFKLIKNFKFKHISLPLFFYRRHNVNLTNNKKILYKTRTKILRKFAKQKKKIKDLLINCVIPVRGPGIDPSCRSLDLLNKRPIIFYTIEEALKVQDFNQVILSTSDKQLIKIVKKKYGKKICYHLRDKKLSILNLDFRYSILEAINKFNKRKSIDIVAILTFENPFRKKFYIEQAISKLIIHKSDLAIGTLPDIDNNYYKYCNKGIEIINRYKNNLLRLEKNIILKDVGAFSIYNYNSYKNNTINKITNVILDNSDSFLIHNNLDQKIASYLKKNIRD